MKSPGTEDDLLVPDRTLSVLVFWSHFIKMDWIPGISQVKSLVQIIAGDRKGAERTQQNFLETCPVVSQGTSAVYAMKGDKKKANEVGRKI